eukprot:14167580-Ditylum_brightwellii.AAC.1
MVALMNPSQVHVNEDQFKYDDWVDFYDDVTEEIPSDMPEPLGNTVQLTAWFDSDHEGNLVTRQLQTGYFIFVNQTPILWYNKCQNTFEASTFGAEFIAGRTYLEADKGLHFKLSMFGIPIDRPTCAMCNNSSVVSSTQSREACAAAITCVGKIESKKNQSNLFTKLLPTSAMYDLLSSIVLILRIGLTNVEKEYFGLNSGFKD